MKQLLLGVLAGSLLTAAILWPRSDQTPPRATRPADSGRTASRVPGPSLRPESSRQAEPDTSLATLPPGRIILRIGQGFRFG